MAVVSLTVNRCNGIRLALRRATDSVTMRIAGVLASGRIVTTHSTGVLARLSPMYSTTAAVSGSPQWRSSSSSTQPDSPAMPVRSRTIASPSSIVDARYGSSPGTRHSGTSNANVERRRSSSG